MLVLSRKCQQSVVVGGKPGLSFEVRVTVVEVSVGKVRLGFDAGPAVPVHRGEVWERIRAGAGQPARNQPTSVPGRAAAAPPAANVRSATR